MAFALVSCGVQGTSEFSCAPQNIKYDEETYFLMCDSPNSSTMVGITCNKNTFREELGVKSCVSEFSARIGGRSDNNNNFKYVIKPIVLSEEELFNKKQECSVLIPQIENRLRENDKLSDNMSTLGNVFYSISMNSCLYDVTEFRYRNGKNNTLINWFLYDGFTNKQLLWRSGFEDSTDYQKYRDQFNEQYKRFE